MALVIKNPPVNAGHVRDAGLIPGSRRSLAGGDGMENSMEVYSP